MRARTRSDRPRTRSGAVFCVLLPLLHVPFGAALAQTPPVEIGPAPPEEVQELVLVDGSTLYGRVLEADDPVVFRLVSGSRVSVPRAEVRSVGAARGLVVDGEFWPEDPNRTRLFFGPTARSLPRGDGYLAVYEIAFPFLSLAVTDRVILSGGTPLFFGGGGSRPFWFAPKVTFVDSGRFQAAAGVMAVSVEGDHSGILYGVATHGDQRQSVTMGIGWGYVNGDIASSPALMLGGEIRAGRGLKLVTENYLLPGGEGGVVSLGPRFFGKRLSADLGLVVPIVDGANVVLPLVNFVWNF